MAGAWPASPHLPHSSPPVYMNRIPGSRGCCPRLSAEFAEALECWGSLLGSEKSQRGGEYEMAAYRRHPWEDNSHSTSRAPGRPGCYGQTWSMEEGGMEAGVQAVYPSTPRCDPQQNTSSLWTLIFLSEKHSR